MPYLARRALFSSLIIIGQRKGIDGLINAYPASFCVVSNKVFAHLLLSMLTRLPYSKPKGLPLFLYDGIVLDAIQRNKTR